MTTQELLQRDSEIPHYPVIRQSRGLVLFPAPRGDLTAGCFLVVLGGSFALDHLTQRILEKLRNFRTLRSGHTLYFDRDRAIGRDMDDELALHDHFGRGAGAGLMTRLRRGRA